MKREKSLVKGNKIVHICDKVIEYGIYSLVFFVPIVFCLKFYERFEIIKQGFVFNITLFIFIIWVIKLIESNKIQFSRTALFWGTIIYFSSLVISTILSISPPISLYGTYRQNYGLFINLAFLILFFIISNNLDKSRIKNILLLTIFSGGIVAIYGILQSFGFDPVFGDSEYFGRRASSSLGNPIFLGNFLAMVIPIGIGLLIVSSKIWFKVLLGSINVIMFFCLLLTYSRGAWLAFLCSLLLFVIIVIKKKHIKLKYWWILGCFVILIPPFFCFRDAILSNKLTKRILSIVDLNDPAIMGRLSTWKISLEIIRDHPLGVGLDCFGVVFPKYKTLEYALSQGAGKVAVKAHNEILQNTVSCGLMGLFAYLFFLTIILITAIKLLKTQKSDVSFLINSAIISSLFGNFFSGQFSFPTVTQGMLFWIYISGINIEYKMSSSMKDKEFFCGSILRKLGCVGSILIAVVSIIFANRLVVADYYFYKGLNEINCRSAVFYLNKAVNLNPLVGDYRSKLCYCYIHLNRLKLAEEECLKTLNFLPYDPVTLYNLGIVYYNSGDYNTALSYFEKVISLEIVDTDISKKTREILNKIEYEREREITIKRRK